MQLVVQGEDKASLDVRPSAPAIGSAQMVNGVTDWDGFTEGVPLVAYWLLLKSRWLVIALGTSLAIVVTFVTVRFLVTPYYRATAIVRPVAPENEVGKLNGTLGSLSSRSFAGGGVFGGAQDEQAQEYMSMMRSYAFSIAIVDRYHLEKDLAPTVTHGQLSQWQLYRTLGGRFDCKYDRVTGNLTLHFIDYDVGESRRILGLYVDSLREKLRRREIQSAAAAKASLEDEARTTPDLLLQGQLYELIARQVQREKLAQVEADFAFTVIEPPVVGDASYGPRVARDSAIAGALAFTLLTLAVLLRDSWTRSMRHYHLAVASHRDSHAHPAASPPPG